MFLVYKIFSLYSPLFEESRKEYIRNFSADSFAFLMRKVSVSHKHLIFEILLKYIHSKRLWTKIICLAFYLNILLKILRNQKVSVG